MGEKLTNVFISAEDIEAKLSGLHQSRSQGKTVDSPEVIEALMEFSRAFGLMEEKVSVLSEKFQLGNEFYTKISQEKNLLEDMMAFCMKNKNHLPKVTSAEEDIWCFLVNATMFSPGVSLKLSANKDFLTHGKDVLETLYPVYISKKADKSQESTIFSIITTAHNMCTFCDVTTTSVRAAGFLPVFLQYFESDVVKNDQEKSITTLAAASDIMNENDAITMGNREEIHYMTRGIDEALESTSREFDGWLAFELAKIIGNLAIFDANQRLLVEYGVVGPLVKLAKQSEELEQITATTTLAHLAFDEDNKRTFVSDEQTDLVTTLFDLAKSSQFPAVRESAQGVLWTLSEHLHSSKKYTDLAQDFFKRKIKGHVMISYSREQRPLLLRIKQAITEAGFPVWMDIEQMRENVYDRMAEAIQNSSVVLISMSYSYQRSEYCRREAAYASSLKRARIPLLVDPDYTAEGWLALMTAGDYHYDFVRKPFETKMGELIHELERRCVPSRQTEIDGIPKQETIKKQSHVVLTSSHGHPTYSMPTAHGQVYGPVSVTSKETESSRCRENVEMWKKFAKLNKKQFNAWLEKRHLPRDIFGNYRAKDVVFLAQMKEEAPDSYYKHIMNLFMTKSKTEALRLSTDFTQSLEHLTVTDSH